MWLVLCSSDDLAALWAARGLAARGLRPLEVVTSEALVYNRCLEHRLGAERLSGRITLADGRVIDSATVRGTLNRLQMIPAAHLRAKPADRQYAEQELFALYLSWLHAIPGKMLNRPSSQSLCGEWRHSSEWVWLANEAGLSVNPYSQGDLCAAPRPCFSQAHTRSIITVGGVCCGASAPPVISVGCCRLAALSATELLGVDFHVTPSGRWIFLAATPMPELQVGGDQLQDALFGYLSS